MWEALPNDNKLLHFFGAISVDTPGFENENKTKPEETKIISASGGLAKPEVVAEKILHDSLVNSAPIIPWT